MAREKKGGADDQGENEKEKQVGSVRGHSKEELAKFGYM